MILSGAGLHGDLAAVAQRSGDAGEAESDGKRFRYFQAHAQRLLYAPNQVDVGHQIPR